MSQQLFLTSLFQQRCRDASHLTPLDRFIGIILDCSSPETDLVEQLVLLPDLQKRSSPWHLIERWQETLVLMIFLRERGLLSLYKTLLLERVRLLNGYFLWQEFQLISTYRALCALLLDCQRTVPPVYQMESGACPLESGDHWSWGGVPHTCFHAELGILWCFYGKLNQDTHYFKFAERLAEWQLNTLDYSYRPFVGLFSQEGDVSETGLLIKNYLLFSAVARVTGREDFAFAAEKQRELLTQLIVEYRINIPHIALAIEYSLDLLGEEAVPKSSFPTTTFTDGQLVLAVSRSKEMNAIATLTGGGSGMGSFHQGDVRIVNYGPQHLPLGDCRGFGIESHQERLSHSHVNATMSDGSFHLEGMARIAAHPKEGESNASFRNGNHSGVWIDAKQMLSGGQLSLEMEFHSLQDLSTLAFAFFVKAQSCIVDTRQIIRPRSFERYQGQVRPIRFRGKQSSIEINAMQSQGALQVIPLGGGDNFWGADFLIAYLFDPTEKRYAWTIK